MPSNPYKAFCDVWGADYGEALSFVDAYKKKFDKDIMSAWEKRAMRRLQHTETGKALITIYENLKSGGDGGVIKPLIIDHFSAFNPYKWVAPLGSSIPIMVDDKEHYIIEVRSQYDFKEEEEKKNFICTIGILCIEKTILFRKKPETIRLGYKVHDDEGNYRIEGDASLFVPTYEDELEAAAFRQVAERLFPEE